jgi:hypothetical protein
MIAASLAVKKGVMPLLTAGHQIPRGERIGEFLQAIGSCAFQEGVGNLLESDAFLTHALRQPMVLIEADTGGERNVGQMRTNIRPRANACRGTISPYPIVRPVMNAK